MSALRIPAALFCVCFARAALAGESFPHVVQVGSAGAVVRSGPGGTCYATDQLQAGEEVEVWQRAAGGWLAIRPPQSSYSLVVASHLRRIPGSDLAEVRAADVEAWLGSNLGHLGDHASHVKLHAGEKVIVLGETQQRLREGAPPETLCRIAPPSGEFRWVREADVRERISASSDADCGVQQADYQGAADQDAAKPGAEPARDGFVARRKRSASVKPGGAAPAKQTARASVPSRAANSVVPSAAFDQALRDLELRLSLMAAEPPASWDFAGLRDEAHLLLDRGTTTLERARAQRLLDQVEEFDLLRRRHALLGGPMEDGAEDSGGGRTAEAGYPLVDRRFDGTGWLLPVHSTQRTAPPYALLDAEGRILQFVSPSPGLNLHRYLRKEVGIYGQRSLIGSLDKPHVTAQRVVELDRHRR